MGIKALTSCKKRLHTSYSRYSEKYRDNSQQQIVVQKNNNQKNDGKNEKNEQKIEQSTNEQEYVKNLEEELIKAIKLKQTQIFYASASSSVLPQQSKRLLSEISVLQKYLPLYKSNSIFLRYDDGKINLMQALIMGADGTPYANGMFLFDIHFGQDYPQNPPKMQLMTTGQGAVRFNPNLYSSGYICLSLLGTWSGNVNEKWDAQKSNLLQILLSIQSLVMSEGVYYNEPGHDYDKHTAGGKKLNEAYSNIVRFATIKYAIKQQLISPPHGFEEVVKKHVFYKKKDILETCEKWLKEAEKDESQSYYTGLVMSHNIKFASEFAKEKLAYYNALKKEIDELTVEINKIKF